MIKTDTRREFTGCPVVRTLGFHCRESGFHVSSGELQQSIQYSQKQTKKYTQENKNREIEELISTKGTPFVMKMFLKKTSGPNSFTGEFYQILCAWEQSRFQSCPTLCNPTDCTPPCFFAHGTLQARILEWVAMSYSRGSSPPNRD